MKAGRIILHPFLFALYLVAGAYREVKPLADPADVLPWVPLLWLAAGLLMGLFYGALRDGRKAGLLATLVLFYLGLSGEIEITWSALVRGTPLAFLAQLWITLSVLTILAIILAVAVVRTKRDLAAHTRALHAATLALLLVSVPGLCWDGRDRELHAFMKARVMPSLKAPARPPDVYYLVLDGCTSVGSMKTHFKCEPVELLDYLADHGFQVVTNARSEFTLTQLSLATSLNLHIPPRFSFGYESRYGKNTLLSLLRHGTVPASLQAAGYEIVNLGMTPLGESPARYEFLPVISFVTVGNALRNRSIVKKIPFLLRHSKSKRVNEREARRILQPLVDLETVARTRSSRPRFVFCHVMLPHPPFKFLRDGQVREAVWGKQGKDKDYREQLLFTTRRIIPAVEAILKASDVDPVIVIQGDHGYRKLRAGGAAAEDEAHSVLLAYHCPGEPRALAWEGFETANIFRVVFNQVFEAGLPYVESDPAEEKRYSGDDE